MTNELAFRRRPAPPRMFINSIIHAFEVVFLGNTVGTFVISTLRGDNVQESEILMIIIEEKRLGERSAREAKIPPL